MELELEWQDLVSHVDTFLNLTLFKLNQTPVTLMSIVVFVFFVAVFALLGRMVRSILYKRVLNRFQLDRGLRYTLSQVTQYVVFLIGLLFSFQFIGLDLSSLAVVFGLLSVGIGFGLQNLTSNFVSGLIVLFERPISVGDRIVVNDIEGDVTEINIRSTTIRTLNNVSIIVPNSDFVSKEVINYSHSDSVFRLDLPVGVSYSSDLDNVVASLRKVAHEHKRVLDKPKPEVHLLEFGDSSWNMELRVFIYDVREYPWIRNEMNQAIVRAFAKYGVEIPFPQRDLHVRSPLPVPLDNSGAKSA